MSDQNNSTAKAEPKEIVGLMQAPEIHVDGFQGVAISNSSMKVNFYTELLDPSGEAAIRRSALVMVSSPETFVRIRDALDGLVKRLEEDGVIEVNREDSE